jgi:hypothetical protein
MTDWQSMATAPKDGTRIWLRVRHFNWRYAGEHDREKWEQDVSAMWIEHNGGGWTWNGIMGEPIAWLPLPPDETAICTKCGKEP